jgi:hypothetical protein
LVLESYGDGTGSLATTKHVELARALFAQAAQAEIEALTREAEEQQPLAASV